MIHHAIYQDKSFVLLHHYFPKIIVIIIITDTITNHSM